MKILTRYIIREHIPPFFFALAILMFIFLMNFLVKYISQIFGKGLSIITIFELFFYNLAWMFALAVPMSVLVATLMSFGRLSGDNEITILKSSGISIFRIIRPALIFAAIVTLLMIIFNDKILPDFNHKAKVIFKNIRQKKPTLKLEPGIFFEVDKYSFQVEKIKKISNNEMTDPSIFFAPEFKKNEEPDKLINVTIFDRSNPSKTITVTAKEGYMVYSSAKKSLIFTLYDGEYHEFDNTNVEEYKFSHFKKNVVYMDAANFELEKREDDYRGDREMNIVMMMDKVRELKKSISEEEDRINKKIKNSLVQEKHFISKEKSVTINIDSLKRSTEDQWQRAQQHAQRKINQLNQTLRTSNSLLTNYIRSINRYMVEIHKKFSIPFSCIVFIIIGAPLGIAARKGSLGVGTTLSIFFFLVYWICLILGEDLADRMIISAFWSMWFPNLLIGSVGLYLTWRAVKETTIINWDKIIAFSTKYISRIYKIKTENKEEKG
jgi:lipopolysaccharide export system permease protein